jgi:predicted GNAT superfamily acetyltransferase
MTNEIDGGVAVTSPSLVLPADATVTDSVTIRRVHTIAEYRQCETLQERIWGADDVAGNRLVAMLTAQENGGQVLGAFTDTEQLVGLAYSFIGVDAQRRLKQCSIVVGVDSRYRGHGLGYQLKLAQRRNSLAQGIDLITWTFDPLLRVNAALNIRRLGGTAREYQLNLYGSCDGLNAGLDTDRLTVEWWLRRHPRPRHWSEPCLAVPVNHLIADPQTGLPRIMSVEHDVDDDDLFLAVPPNFLELKRHDLALAQEWRLLTRGLFLEYLRRGYVVVDFITAGAWPGYVLRRPAW